MTPPRAAYANSLGVSVNLSSEELSALENNLRFESGPSVVTPERTKELKAMLDLVDKDIEGLSSQLTHLETQRAKLLSLLSPMRKLPNETLLHIFQDVCEGNLLQCYPWRIEKGDEDDEDEDEGILDAELQPSTKITSPVITYLPTMAISSVCSRWRELALLAPSLWTNLRVETHTTSLDEDEIFETFAGFIDTVTRYLERSGDSPLNLELDICGPTAYEEIPCLNNLTEHAWRWKTFEYSGSNSLTDYHLLFEISFPFLNTLDVSSADLNLFKDSPRLRTLFGYGPHTMTSARKVLYNQLHRFNCGQYSLSDLGYVLPSCPSLKSLELGYLPHRLGSVQPSGTWHNITFLAAVNGGELDTMFSRFNFPSLKKLVVDGGDPMVHTYWPTNPFASFISRSSCMITTFTLQGVSLSDVDLIAALRIMPALLHLEVDEKLHSTRFTEHQSPITSHLLSSLTLHRSTSISLVPKLHGLHLRYISQPVDAFDDAAFVAMIESRWFRPGSDLFAEMLAMGRNCIRSVVLKLDARKVDAEIYKPLRVLDTEGLRVVVSGTNGLQV